MDRYEQAWEWDKKFWQIVDVQRDSWYHRMYKSPELRRALRTDGTIRVLRSLIQLATGMSKTKHEGGNVVIAIKGFKRVGKSFMAKILAKIWQRIMLEEFEIKSVIKTVYKVDHVRKVIKELRARRDRGKGALIIVDESGRLTGMEAVTALINLVNLLEQMGVTRIGVIFIGPNFDFKSVGGALDIGLEHFGSNFKYEMCRAVVFDKEDHPLYVAGFQRNFYWSEFPSYDEDKRGKVDALIESYGAEEAFDQEKFDEDYARLIAHLRVKYTHTLTAGKLPKTRTVENQAKRLKPPISGNTNYIAKLAATILDDLREEQLQEEPDDTTTPSGYIPSGAHAQEEEEKLLKYLEWSFNKVLRKSKANISQERIDEIIRYYVFSESPQMIASERGVGADAVRKNIKNNKIKISETEKGNIGELAAQKLLQELLPPGIFRVARGRRCDCLSTKDNGIDLGIGEGKGEGFVAVNVKVDWDEVARAYHHSPEYKHEPHMTLVVRLRELQRKKERRTRAYWVMDPPEYETLAVAKKRGGVLEFQEGVKRLVELLENMKKDQVRSKMDELDLWVECPECGEQQGSMLLGSIDDPEQVFRCEACGNTWKEKASAHLIKHARVLKVALGIMHKSIVPISRAIESQEKGT